MAIGRPAILFRFPPSIRIPAASSTCANLVNTLAAQGSVGPVNRLNLNRKLTSYPDPVSGAIPTGARS